VLTVLPEATVSQLTHRSNCPANNISARAANKTPIIASRSYCTDHVEDTDSKLLYCCMLRISCPETAVFSELFPSNACLCCLHSSCREQLCHNIVMDLINALPGNSFVNTMQHATIEKAVFSRSDQRAIDWLDSDHVLCVYCRSMSVSRLYNESREL
jgi:hypothetical protein